MWWPEPKVPKNFFSWKLKNRQMFCRLYWNPMWNAKKFCNKWLTVKGIKLMCEGLSFRIGLWLYTRKCNRKNKGGSKWLRTKYLNGK